MLSTEWFIDLRNDFLSVLQAGKFQIKANSSGVDGPPSCSTDGHLPTRPRTVDEDRDLSGVASLGH